MNEVRVKAAELALCVSKTADELVEAAEKVLAFLEAGSSKSDSKPATSAKAKAAKASSASTPAASESPAATSSTSTASESTASAAASTPASGTSPASSTPSPTPSLDDVRTALTKRQARDGGDATQAKAILGKYAKTGTLGSLAEADRAKVIAECAA